MESTSPSPISPVWPTNWPKDAFKAGPTIGLAAIALVVGIVGSAIAAFVVVLLNPDATPKFATFVNALILQAGFNFGVIGTLLAGLPRVARFSRRELGFAVPQWSTIGIAIGGTAASILIVSLVGALMDALLHQRHQQAIIHMFLQLHDPGRVAFFVVFAAIIAPVTEELFFRAFLFNAGLRYIGLWGSVAVTSILFGLAHGSPLDAIPLACVGAVQALVYYYTRNAYASMISHALFNTFTVAGLLIAPKLAGG